jgi:triosephosphate isomerase
LYWRNPERKKTKKTNQILKRQIEKGLKSIKNKSKIIIAYEPVWSIGTGVIPKEADLNKTISFIKSRFIKKYPKILYGGSVNANNVSILKKIPNIDGFLIGSASQIPKKFIDIIKKTIN